MLPLAQNDEEIRTEVCSTMKRPEFLTSKNSLKIQTSMKIPWLNCFKAADMDITFKALKVVVGHARKSMSCKRRKTATNGLHSPVQVKTPTMIRAEEVQSSLGSEFPSFTKLLVRSHVASCFWMGLPVPFCKLHLPRNDTTFTLEDESGEQFELKFIAEKPGLSAGWRKFAVGHKLLEGDVLIFQLVESNKFKITQVSA